MGEDKTKKTETLTIRGGEGTPDVVLVKEIVHGVKVWTADVRDRGVRYNPNPYPPKSEEDK